MTIKNYNAEISSIVFNAALGDGTMLRELAALLRQAYEDGYDQAAQDITMKLQELIPKSATNVPDARVQGAWRDAANVALNHLGKLSRTGK